MTRKKNSFLKPAVLITLIVALNLLGISYGYWQDSLIGLLKAQTGYIDLRFVGEPNAAEIEAAEVFSGLHAKLDKDDKTIKVTGNIEKGKDGTLVIEYSVFNHGSLPVIFDKIQVKNLQKEGITVKEPNQLGIDPGNSLSDSITIEIDAPKADETQGDDIESYVIEEDTSDAYEFGIVLTYSIESWKDELYIDINIGVTQSNPAFTTMLAPMPAMTFMPVEGEIVTGGLPEGPSDEELYGEGGSEQTSEGNDRGEGPGDEELYDTGGTTEEADGEEELGNQEQVDGGEEAEGTDEPETIGDDNEPVSDSKDEEEGSNEESEEADGEEESGNQEQADGGEAAEEADEPEEAEDNSQPASADDGEGESSDELIN